PLRPLVRAPRARRAADAGSPRERPWRADRGLLERRAPAGREAARPPAGLVGPLPRVRQRWHERALPAGRSLRRAHAGDDRRPRGRRRRNPPARAGARGARLVLAAQSPLVLRRARLLPRDLAVRPGRGPLPRGRAESRPTPFPPPPPRDRLR